MTELCWCGGTNAGGMCTASKFHTPTRVEATEEPKVLYVSGPMSGYEDCNYPAFNAAVDLLRAHGYITVNPADIGVESGQYTDLLKKDIKLLLMCEGVAVLEGWWSSRGAMAEVSVAGVIGLPVRPVAEWVARSNS